MARNKREYRGQNKTEPRWNLARGKAESSGGLASRLLQRRSSVTPAKTDALLNKKRKPAKVQKHPGLAARVVSRHFDWPRFRLRAVAVFFGLLWLGLWFRAYQVQIVDGPALAERAARQHRTTEFVVGERGQIFDSNGRLLAKSVAIKSIFANPARVQNPAETAMVLAEILGQDAKAIRARLDSDSPHVWIARQIGDAPAARVRDAKLPGIHITTEYARQYPNKHLAGRLVGFVGTDDKGLEGLEASLDQFLAGKQSTYSVERDATGRKLYFDAQGEEVDIRGRDVRLTLDINLQNTAEEALETAVKLYKAKWGGCLVVRVQDGHVMAWAESPRFNPNAYGKYKPDQWRNRLAMDSFEPGSSAKPLLVAAALQEGVVGAETVFYCENGRMNLDRKTIRDVSAKEWLSVTNILRHSSNIGTAKIAMALGAEKYHAYLSRLGFGNKLGLPLTGESTGILRPPKTWERIELATSGFGQGFSVTLAQLATAYLCLANEGLAKPLRLVLDPPVQQQYETRVFEPAVAREVLRMLENVVTDGTGVRAQIQGLSVAGKTSTAQKASPQGGYGKEVVASFVGMVPAQQPEYLILISIDEPDTARFGGVVAAPAFREVALKTMAYLGRLPDVAVATAPEPAPEFVQSVSTVRFCSTSEIREKVDKTCVIPGDAVPDVRGLSIRRAIEILAGKGVVPSLKGAGSVVVRQEPAPGQPWPVGTNQCTLWLQDHAEPL